jgi:hypothetical protein
MKVPIARAAPRKDPRRWWFSTFAVDNIVHKRLKKRLSPGGGGKDIKLTIFWTAANESIKIN